MKSPPIKIKEVSKNTCSRILTPKQVGPICWFMATFVAMFYSQRSRKILLDASKGWDIKKGKFKIFLNNREKLFALLKQILDDKYLKTKSKEGKDYKKFSDNTFGKILALLNKVDMKAFPYKPKYIFGGFSPLGYIGKLYKLLNVDYIMFEYNLYDKVLAYSFFNEEFNNNILYYIKESKILPYFFQNKTFNYVEENIPPPPILMVIVRNTDYWTEYYYNGFFPNNIINNGDTKKNITSMEETIYYRGVEYHLDSVILVNWNENLIANHSIAGITCKQEKYIYNGWTRTTMDTAMANILFTRNIPCELMPHNWKIKEGYDFCLNTKDCIPDALRDKLSLVHSELCFNFSKGTRLLIYVKKNNKSYTSSSHLPKMSSDIPDISNNEGSHTIILTAENIDNLEVIIQKTSKIDRVILHDVRLTRDIVDLLYTLELSTITHFIITKTKEEYYENDNDIISELLFMIGNMTNIKLLDFSGFDVSHTITFAELFTIMLLKLKKLRYFNFTNNIIDAKTYNKIFRLDNSKAKPDTTNAVMIITDDKNTRKIRFNTGNCATPKIIEQPLPNPLARRALRIFTRENARNKIIDTPNDYKKPTRSSISKPLINYKNPAVDKQMKSIIGELYTNGSNVKKGVKK
jgi:hypothetical protein